MAKRFVEDGLLRKIRRILIPRRRAGSRWPCAGSCHCYSHVVASAYNLDAVHNRNVKRLPIVLYGQTRRGVNYRAKAAKSGQLCVRSVARAVATFDGEEIAAVKCNDPEITRVLPYSLLRIVLRNPGRRGYLLTLCRHHRRRIRALFDFVKRLLGTPIATWPGKMRPGTPGSLGLIRPRTAFAGLKRQASRKLTDRGRPTAWGCGACPCSLGKERSW